MTEALRLELGRMLDRYDEARRLAQDRQQQAKADDALFLQRFAELRRGVVRPCNTKPRSCNEACGASTLRPRNIFLVLRARFN